MAEALNTTFLDGICLAPCFSFKHTTKVQTKKLYCLHQTNCTTVRCMINLHYDGVGTHSVPVIYKVPFPFFKRKQK